MLRLAPHLALGFTALLAACGSTPAPASPSASAAASASAEAPSAQSNPHMIASYSSIAPTVGPLWVTNDTPVYPYIFEVAPGINSPSDLKGKSVGISRFGSSSDIATRVVLKKYGLEPEKDVAFIQTGSTSERMAAMDAGTIQGGLAQPPDTVTLEKKGWRPLLDLASLGLPSSTLGHIVQRSYRDANRAVIQRYVDALVEGVARWRTDKAFDRQILGKYLKQDDQELLNASVEYGVRPALTPSYPYPKPEQFADTIAILGQKNDQLAKVDVSKYLDESFVKSAEDRGVGK
jgi:NitT/TauT family transport system substrate-binding protein